MDIDPKTASWPPTDPVHLQDLDAWLAERLSQFPGQRRMFQELFVAYHESVPEVGVFYTHFKQRLDPSNKKEFKFSDIVYFILTATASGVIGNAAWEAVRTVLRKFREQGGDARLERPEEIVSVEFYEQCRIKVHGKQSAMESLSVDVERMLEFKYSHMVDKLDADR